MDLHGLKAFHYILCKLECSMVFEDDGSIEFKVFIKQFKHYQSNSGVLNNYYSYQIIKNGIKEYANNVFWKEMRSR